MLRNRGSGPLRIWPLRAPARERELLLDRARACAGGSTLVEPLWRMRCVSRFACIPGEPIALVAHSEVGRFGGIRRRLAHADWATERKQGTLENPWRRDREIWSFLAEFAQYTQP